MNKGILFFLSCLVMVSQIYAGQVVLENQTSHPKNENQSIMRIQWASSAREVEEGNQAMIYGRKLDRNTMHDVTLSGKVSVTIPSKAQYFRILVWSKGDESPDLLTNWVDIVPDKTYQLHEDHLVPALLMAGTGC